MEDIRKWEKFLYMYITLYVHPIYVYPITYFEIPQPLCEKQDGKIVITFLHSA